MSLIGACASSTKKLGASQNHKVFKEAAVDTCSGVNAPPPYYMDLRDYLDKRTDELAQQAAQFKDLRAFDFNYIPEQPLMRDEMRTLIDACLRYITTGIPNHLFILGSRGSGKTLSVRFLSQYLKRPDLTWCYVNCREHNTSFKILAHLLHVRPRGTGLDELFQRFRDTHRSRTILILDEIDLLSTKDRNREILYLMSRAPENYMLILLSNHPRFMSTLDESIRSTLQADPIHFRNYNALEIAEILRSRASQGLNAVPEEAIGMIAALSAKITNSDMRVALKTLYYVGLGAEAEGAFHRARRDLVRDLLMALPQPNLLMLQAASHEEDPLVRRVYQRYRSACATLRIAPFSFTYFLSNLSYLQSIGLMLLTSTKVGRTYTNRVQPLFPDDVLSDALHGHERAAYDSAAGKVQ
jgi:cell division control protein 6